MKASFAALALTMSLPFAAQAETFAYKCYSYYWNGYENLSGTMDLSISATEAKADLHEESWDTDLGGRLNPNYKSKGSIVYKKYGRELIVEEALINGGKTLKDGTLGGFARVEGEAEGGFYQYKFVCKR